MNKFYADSMLGKLARFLRFLGYDTLYRREESVEEMINISSQYNRIILTRSEAIVQKCNKLEVSSVLILDINVELQLKLLTDKLNMQFTIPPEYARCSMCNSELEQKEKQEILNLIPSGTAKHYDIFWQCKDCGKLYWIGSHWKDIEKKIIDTIRG